MKKQDKTYMSIQEMAKANAKDPNNRQEVIDQMRKVMGTLPDMQPEFKTEFYRGVEGIEVKLIDHDINPYKAMYNFAAATWGKKLDKWKDTPVEGRVAVVKAVLDRQALPLALEVPNFTFTVEKVSRWAFDQMARQRLGIVFSSMGTRDNNHLDMGFRVHESIWRDPEKLKRFKEVCLHAKEAYKYFVEQGQGSWQEARALLPISCTHNYMFSANFAAIQNMVGKRGQACEAEDVVAIAFLTRHEIGKKFPLLSKYLRPNCDWVQKCTYHKAYSLSEAFGCLFQSCGRWPDEEYKYFHQNGSCSDYKTISEQLGIPIPMGHEDRPEDFNVFESELDMQYFTAE